MKRSQLVGLSSLLLLIVPCYLFSLPFLGFTGLIAAGSGALLGCLVGTETVFGDVGDVFHSAAIITIGFSTNRSFILLYQSPFSKRERSFSRAFFSILEI